MFRRIVPLAVALVVVLGCNKKKDEGGGGGDAPGMGAPAPGGMGPGAMGGGYTIKIRPEQAGDKTEEVVTESGTVDLGPLGQQKEDKKLEYTEHIIDMPAGAAKPTKLTRTYKVAKGVDPVSKGPKSMAYEGKTVSIEKKGAGYEFSVDGKKLSPLEAMDLEREFSKGDTGKIEDVLPKNPVKVGEAWTATPEAMKSLASALPFPIDQNKSKITGKLTKAYTKDGKQWGVIALDGELIVSAPGPGGKGTTSGTIKMDGTLDVAIDGSSREGTMSMKIKMSIPDLKVSADVVTSKTVKNAK